MARIQVTRWRWRMRGAWLVPVFVVVTLAESALLVYLPVWGDGPRDGLVAAALLATFLNTVVIAVLAPLAGMLLRLRRRDLPRVVARDYAGTALLGVLLLALLAGGFVRRGERLAEARERATAVAVAGDWVRREEPEFAPALMAVDTRRIEPGLYRVCVPSAVCVVVNLAENPPVRRDVSRLGNQAYFRADGGGG